ncbi:MAG: hypothetical protein WC791_04355 [Candidatus Paceibacterota bacterium]|jgi:hypothetical protein
MKTSITTKVRRAIIILMFGYCVDMLMVLGWWICSIFETILMTFDRHGMQVFFNRYQPQYILPTPLFSKQTP